MRFGILAAFGIAAMMGIGSSPDLKVELNNSYSAANARWNGFSTGNANRKKKSNRNRLSHNAKVKRRINNA